MRAAGIRDVCAAQAPADGRALAGARVAAVSSRPYRREEDPMPRRTRLALAPLLLLVSLASACQP
ncbi:MAG TPA: hypothetical protein VLL75_16810, partial [Vicinamibacteria bacterium]|nr:hypothetical protein [Vicinamibacteria bacterium]